MSQLTGAPPTADATQPRTPEQIEAEIALTRESLAVEIDVLQERLSPANLAQAAKARAIGLLRRPDGSLDAVRVAAAASVALVLVTYLVRRRRL